MDLSLKLNSVALAIRQLLGFSPASLFAAGEQGAWYDPSDLTTLFQDQAGTTPVTAVEQPVSLMLDKSKGGDAIGADTVVNGTFAADSDWTKGTDWTIGSGVATKTAGTAAVLSQAATLTAGRSYIVTYTITRTAGTLIARFTGATTVSGTARSAAGTYTDILTAVSGNTTLEFSADSSFAGTVDNVTLKQLPAGNHAYTPSTATASRPVLSARVNLLTKTEQFDDGAWTKTNSSITANTIVAPDGTLTADKTVPNNGTSGFVLGNTSVSAATYTASVFAKAGEFTFLRINLQPPEGGNQNTYFDLVNGTVGTSAAGNTNAITSVGNGWWKCSVTRTVTGTGNMNVIFQAGSANNTVATGDGTSGIYLWGADLRVANDGVGIPSYQRVNTSTDYDTVGFPLYLRCDGTDDYMLTNSINFTATDKMTVWAGVRKLSNAEGFVVELSAGTSSNNGSFDMLAPGPSSSYIFRSRGSIRQEAPATGFATPITNILTGVSNISGDEVILRVNNTQTGSSTADQGTGNYGNYPLYLFRRAGTSFPFNGRCYGMIVRGAQSSTAQIEATETYMNTKTKAF